MIQYPLHFGSRTSAKSGIDSPWTTESSSKESHISIPTEFLGPGGELSPEDLFNQALTNCFVATFKVFAQHSKLAFEDLTVNSTLTVDLDERKRPVMSTFHLKAVIVSPSNVEKALQLAKRAAENGFILNSVKTVCHFEFEVA